MKSGSYSMLLELCIMMAVFTAASLLCVRAFLLARDTSAESAERDQAVICAANTAEALKAAHRAEAETLFYDESWQPTEASGCYTLSVLPLEAGLPGLGSACVCVCRADGRELLSLTVSWQEVD